MRFIKSLSTSPIKQSAFIAFFCVTLLASCSTAPNSNDANTPNLAESSDTAEKNIVDMVNITHKDANHTLTAIADKQDQRNVYLEQAPQRLAEVPAAVLAQYQQAINAMKNQQWQNANSLFDHVIAAQPQLSGAYVNKAIIAINQQAFEQADTLLDQAIKANSSNPYAHQIKANLARQQGQYAQAEQGYLTALALWPQYPQAQINLAILLELYRGKLLQARQFYLAFLANQPDDEQAKRWLAGVEIKIQRAGLTLPENSNGAG
ncbi:tetratricopeptide repeat protein [Shewanella metallivivens]|uniref:Tetratricopeptide repeat protein n=1 Tax=Shewanella metallivivens TaxID=2872342 RepID=A0ABT5TIY9_9GAMM|nr:tetratricopeptide repeat protein [Shewanella metallivivens]MDD8058565.1 tetratricopeptide repeat protein [Shewanella metallivivens]